MGDSIAFITQTREDLTATAKLLSSNIQKNALRYPENPVIVSIYGTWMTGKSLIGEEMAQNISGERPQFHCPSQNGNAIKTITARELQFQFSDISCFLMGANQLKTQRRIVQEMIERQTAGGVVFIQNAPYVCKNIADIEIMLGASHQVPSVGDERYKPRTTKFNIDPMDKLHGLKNGLGYEYHQASLKEDVDWLRYVEIDFKNPAIFNPDFLEKLKFLDKFQFQIRTRGFEEVELAALSL